jgi:glycosyltransferase involved in cell wall biosynthesis
MTKRVTDLRQASRLPNVLFVVGQLTIGGIETYVVRMARAYSKAGGKVSIWVVKRSWDPELLSLLKDVADVTFISKLTHYPVWMHSPALPPKVDLVFTTGRLSLLIAAYACVKAAWPVRLVAGVFSQWEYCSDAANPKSGLASEILNKIGPTNTVFCTEGCRSYHQTKLGMDFTVSIVSPLLVDLPTPSTRRRRKQKDPIQIVSVSRIVSFKTSNYQMPGVIKQLVERGVDAYWTHYGDGPEGAHVQAKIAEFNVGSRAKLAGTVPYSKIHKIIEKADLYVGGGTTLIEAAALGVPSLVALDENPTATTPGFFFDRLGHYTSDLAGDEELEDIVDVIHRFSLLDDAELNKYRHKSLERASKYSVQQSSAEIKMIYEKAKPVLLSRSRYAHLRFIWSNIIEALSTIGRKLKLKSAVDERRR